MSEPMTNVEIEDVLSSIRRLVSEDGPRMSPRKESRTGSRTASGASRRSVPPPAAKEPPLILTPAFRVVDDGAGPLARAGDVPDGHRADPGGGTPAIDPRAGTSESEAAAFFALGRRSTDPVAGTPGKDAPDVTAPAAGESAAGESGTGASGTDAPFAKAAGPLAPKSVPPDSPASGAALEETARAAAPVAESPGVSASAMPASVTPASVTLRAAASALGAEASDADAPTAGGEAQAGTEGPAGNSGLTLEERIASLEAAIGRSTAALESAASRSPQPTVRRAVVRPAAGTTAADALDRRAEPPVQDALRPGKGGMAVSRDSDNYDDIAGLASIEADARAEAMAVAGAQATQLEEALIDEDSLREIVSDLVRQELRGDLGVQITRNVRRLIRREINRAVALTALEDDGDD